MSINHRTLLTGAAALATALPAAAQQERTVPNLFLQFSNLNAKADPIGSNIGVAADIPSVLQCMHYQGIVRLENAGTPYFIITRSGNATITCPANPDTPGELVVVQMGSRGTDGERLRSNRLGLNSRFNDTAPDSRDTAVVSIPLDGFAQDGYGNTWPGWCHPGGCQLIDNVLCVPVEHNFTTADDTDGGIMLIDVSNPLAPRLIKNVDLDTKIGTLGVTKDPVDGRYLFALGGSFLSDNGVQFMKSVGTTLDESFAFDASTSSFWLSELDADPGDNTVWDQDSWQSIVFVRQQDGRLGLITTSDSDGVEIGIGRVRLWEVIQNGNTYDLDFWAARDMGMKEPTTGDMDAGAGVYVSPTGELVIYVCEHISNGPGNSIRMGEFRHENMNYAGDCGCDGWISMYETTTGWDNRNSQNHVVDFQDYALEEWYDLRDYEDHSLDLNGFSDEAESVRWNIPPGRIGELHRDENYTGGAFLLDGTGHPMALSNLNDFGWGDEATSVRFLNRQPNMYVKLTPGLCPIPGGFGTGNCPYYGPGAIQKAADRIGAPPCFNAQTMFIESGVYNEIVHIDRAMTITAANGPVTIVGQ